MSARTIETKAIISAEDKSGAGFASFLRNLHQAESASKQARLSVAAADREAAKVAKAAYSAQVAHARELAQVQREIQHHGIRRYVAQTAATAVAAHSVVDVIRDSVKAGAHYQHEITALQNAGRNAEEMKEITAAARDAVKQLPTSTYAENLRVINETTSAFGSLNHAIENLPFMQKSASVLQAAMPAGSHVDASVIGNEMARAFEERGTAGNAELFRKEASEVMRGMVFSGGKFNPHELLNFAQQAKSSLQSYNLEFLSRVAPSIIGTMNGERAGTAANAFSDVINGKANDEKQAAEWMKYHLLDPKQTVMKKGKAVAWRAGAVLDTRLAMANPLEWAEKVVLPRMQAGGVDINDQEKLREVLATMFRKGTSNFFANEIMQAAQRQRLHKDAAMINQAGTIDEIYARNLKQDPTVALTAFTASLDNFVTVMSKAAMPMVASGLTSLATGIDAISNALHDHPLLATTGGALAAGGALAGSGYAAYNLANGFGLSASATALDGSAVALTEAAALLSGNGAISSAASLGSKAGKAAGLLGLGAAGSTAVVAGAGAVLAGGMLYGADQYRQARPSEFWSARYGGKAMYDRLHPETPMDGHWVEAIPAGRGHAASPRRWVANPRSPSLAAQFPSVGGFDPGNPFGKAAAAPQQVAVKIEPPAPMKMVFEVVPSSVLLQIVESAKTASIQLKARADTGPGGLGETHTGQ